MEKLTEGYCILTDTISGTELVWRTGEGEDAYPVIYKTVEECRHEIVQDAIDNLQEYIDGNREWDEIQGIEEYTLAYIKIFPDGTMVIVEQEGYESSIYTTLEKWRKGL